VGLHYQLENNEIGLCFNCGLVIDGGEDGCVAYTKEGIALLQEQGVSVAMLDLFFLAYQLQHYAYFGLSESDAMSMLRTIDAYVVQEAGDAVAQTSMSMSDNLTLKPVHSPIFMVQVLQAKTKKERHALIAQYIRDIWQGYTTGQAV